MNVNFMTLLINFKTLAKKITRKARPPSKKPPAFEVTVDYTRDKVIEFQEVTKIKSWRQKLPTSNPDIPSLLNSIKSFDNQKLKKPTIKREPSILDMIKKFNPMKLKKTTTVVKTLPIELPVCRHDIFEIHYVARNPLAWRFSTSAASRVPVIIWSVRCLDFDDFSTSTSCFGNGRLASPTPRFTNDKFSIYVVGVMERPPVATLPTIQLEVTSSSIKIRTKVPQDILISTLVTQLAKKLPSDTYKPFFGMQTLWRKVKNFRW